MSLLINNDLIWLSIPKCASSSVEDTLFKSNLIIKKYVAPSDFINVHHHIPLNDLYDEFGHKDSLCVKRNWFDRWISCLGEIWYLIDAFNFKPICKFEDIDNNFIYKTFTNNFVNDGYSGDYEKCSKKLIEDYHTPNSVISNMVMISFSQNWWKCNKSCTYEFDINELNKLEDFIYNRYGENISIPKINTHKHKKNKIIVNDELKNWIWDNFEKRFHKPITLI